MTKAFPFVYAQVVVAPQTSPIDPNIDEFVSTLVEAPKVYGVARAAIGLVSIV